MTTYDYEFTEIPQIHHSVQYQLNKPFNANKCRTHKKKGYTKSKKTVSSNKPSQENRKE